MPRASLNALILGYRSEIDWLIAQAVEFETGQRKLTGRIGGKEVDISSKIADQYRYKADKMQAMLSAYEGLGAERAVNVSTRPF